jgi:hypothetical protein
VRHMTSYLYSTSSFGNPGEAAGRSQTVEFIKTLDRLMSAPASRHRDSSEAPQQIINTKVDRTAPDIRARFVSAGGYVNIHGLGQ